MQLIVLFVLKRTNWLCDIDKGPLELRNNDKIGAVYTFHNVNKSMKGR